MSCAAIGVLFLALMSGPVKADDLAQLQAEASQIIAALNPRKHQGYVTFGASREIREAFANAVGFIQHVSHAHISDQKKGELITGVAAASAKTFDALTRPYVDPVIARAEGYRSSYDTGFNWVVRRMGATLGSFFRDWRSAYIPMTFSENGKAEWSLPTATPLVGQDSMRSNLIKKIARDIEKTFDAEAKSAQASGASRLGLHGINSLIERLGHSEPMHYGRHNQVVAWAYRGLALLTFLMPPLEFAITRTTFSSPVSGAMWAGWFLHLAYARSQNSGLDFYRTIERLRKKSAELLKGQSCAVLLTGERE